MRFLANENFPLPSINLLRENGYYVKSITAELAGIPDREVVKIALDETLIILTFDKDYGEIIFRHGELSPPAVVFMRYRGANPYASGSMLLKLIEPGMHFENSFTVVDEHNVRQRRY